MLCRRTANLPCLALLCGGLIGVAAPATVHAAGLVAPEPAPPAEAPDAVAPTPTTPTAEQGVSASSSPDAGSPPAEGAPPAAESAPGAEATVPEPPPAEAPAPAEATSPETEATEPAAETPTPAEPAVPEPAISTGLLDATPAPAAPKAAAPRTVQYDTEDPEQVEAMLAEEYRQRYRSDGQGARLNITARMHFANVGSSNGSGVGGRMGGASIDVGPAWNRVSVAGTLSAYGGRVYLPEETGAEMNALIGGGPTLGYGRLALLGKGFLDLRLGYHFYYGAVGARRGGPALVATQSDGGGVALTQTENVSPHGPRVRMDLGLLSQANHKRFHAFGLSMGYQGLVHTLRGELPVTHMLTLGISYWMG